jgi:hypothetical protein
MGGLEPPGNKPNQFGIPPKWLDAIGGALVEHGPKFRSVSDLVAGVQARLELALLAKSPEQLESVLYYMDRSHGNELPKLFVQQCLPPSPDTHFDGPSVISVSAFATSGHLAKEIAHSLSTYGIDFLSVPYHGHVSTFTELLARTLEHELDEVHAAVRRVTGQTSTEFLSGGPNPGFPIGTGYSAGGLKALTVTLQAAEAGHQLPFQALLLVSMPPLLTNEALRPLLDGAHRAFRHASLTIDPNFNFPMSIDMARVFANNPPWPKWLGKLDYVPLASIIAIRQMQKIIEDKMEFLPKDFPIYIIHSEEDDLCNLSCARAFYDKIPSSNKQFFVVPGPHLPNVSEPYSLKNGAGLSEQDAQMYRSIANNLILNCTTELIASVEW